MLGNPSLLPNRYQASVKFLKTFQIAVPTPRRAVLLQCGTESQKTNTGKGFEFGLDPIPCAGILPNFLMEGESPDD